MSLRFSSRKYNKTVCLKSDVIELLQNAMETIDFEQAEM